MKKLLILLLLIAIKSNAQLLDISMAPEPEYVSYSPLYVYTMKDGKYLTNYIKLPYNKETGIFSVELTQGEIVDIKNSIATNPKIFDYIVPYADIRRGNFKDLMAELEALEFADPRYSFTMNFTGGYAVYNCCRTYEGKTYYGGQFYDIVPVTINNSKTILYLLNDNSIAGYILPLKDKFYMKLYNQHVKPVAGPTNNKNLREALTQVFPQGRIFNEDGKYGLKAGSFAAPLIVPAVYDSLKIMARGYIAAYTKDSPKLLYNNGEPAIRQPIRAVYNNGGNVSVLADGKVQWVLADGTLGDKLPMMEGCGTVPHVTDSIIRKGGFYVNRNIYQYGERRVKDEVIIKADRYKKLEYLNQSVMHDRYFMGEVSYALPDDCFIATSSNGKRSIVQIKYKEKDPAVRELFDITGFKLLSNNLYEPFRYQANGLKGVWPQGKRAKYKELGVFEKGFARFEYPDGRSGWLCLDGNEYFDE